jgi:rod shape determining protein RodA
MFNQHSRVKKDYFFIAGIGLLVIFGLVVLGSIAPSIFPAYIFFVVLALIAFLVLHNISFDVFSVFSWHFYIGSIVFLLLPIVIGQLTRGTVRWISIGSFTIQPSEIVRPFLLVFFANFLTKEKLSLGRFIQASLLLLVPVFLIVVQPSLGVAILTIIAFLGVLLASDFNKKWLLIGLASLFILLPVGYKFLKPYQRERIQTFINPTQDPFGAGYNSLQSVIAIGSGKIFGRGLGKGIQTQLAFLPERQTDFIFASIAEEMGIFGALIIVLGLFFVLYRLVKFMNVVQSIAARAFISGLTLTLLAQIFVHIGMNLGLLPITGVPLPLISAGGSSLLGTIIGLSIAMGAVRKDSP